MRFHLDMSEVLLAKGLRGHLLTAAGLHVLHRCHAPIDDWFGWRRLLKGPGELLWIVPAVTHGIHCQSRVGLLHNLHG